MSLFEFVVAVVVALTLVGHVFLLVRRRHRDEMEAAYLRGLEAGLASPQAAAQVLRQVRGVSVRLVEEGEEVS